jgi:DNA-binding transcriptional MocR family regulator
METLYLSLANKLEDLMQKGVFQAGDRLPSVRNLSHQHNVSVTTAVKAVRVLENRGLIDVRERSGHFVSPRNSRFQSTFEQERDKPVSQPNLVTPMELTQDMAVLNLGQVFPAGSAIPCDDYLPIRALQKSMKWATRNVRKTLDYGYPAKPEFQKAIAQRMASLGVICGPDDVIATNGTQEALVIALRAVTQPGDVVAIAVPAYPGILQALQVAGLKVLEIPTHPSEGISIEGLKFAIQQWPVSACIVIGNHSNPMGITMSDAHKKALVELLANAHIPLIEDDVYGDLQHEGDRPAPIKAFDKTENVIYCNSFSKTLSPGLRSGWILPGRFARAISTEKYFNNLASSSMTQVVVAHLLREGGYEHHMRVVRHRYRSNTEQLRNLVRSHFPSDTEITRPDGGFIIWVKVPGSDSFELFKQCERENIYIAPGRLFASANNYDDCFRLSASRPIDGRMEDAIKTIGRLQVGMLKHDSSEVS